MGAMTDRGVYSLIVKTTGASKHCAYVRLLRNGNAVVNGLVALRNIWHLVSMVLVLNGRI